MGTMKMTALHLAAQVGKNVYYGGLALGEEVL